MSATWFPNGASMEWVQVYNPLGWSWLSSLVAGLPIVVLLGLAGLRASRRRGPPWPDWLTALAVAIGVFRMPAAAALAAAAYGACFGLLPIGWIVLAAVFLFHLTVRSGQFEVVKRSVTAISPDRRMQALLIAFCFGTFLGGRGRLRHAGGHLGRPADRHRLLAAVRRRPGPAGQHVAGGLRRLGHADHHAGEGLRHRRNGL